MEYTVELEINKPIDQVVVLFDNADNLKKWMEGLKSVEHLSGVPGEKGAKSKMIFQMGKRNIEMIETITVNNLPREFTATYDAKGVHNIVSSRFEKISDEKTRYVSWNKFQFKGFMKFVAFLMPGAFKKQSFKYLEDFKRFAEST